MCSAAAASHYMYTGGEGYQGTGDENAAQLSMPRSAKVLQLAAKHVQLTDEKPCLWAQGASDDTVF